MFWVIQSNLYKEYAFLELVRILTLMDIPFAMVKPLSFTNKLVAPDFELNGQKYEDIPGIEVDTQNKNVFVCGAYTLAKIAKERNWTPGAFLNDNFKFSSWLENWGADNMLNSHIIVSSIKNLVIPSTWDKFFARPLHDTKSFSGTVFHKNDFISWTKSLKNLNKSTLTEDTEIIIAPLKNILAEYRLFIVDGKIVTGSLYKIRDLVIYKDLIPDDLIEYAKKQISVWTPDRAFVLDIADTDEGYKIIEVNNINSSGFYASNIGKFIEAIENMEFPSPMKKKII